MIREFERLLKLVTSTMRNNSTISQLLAQATELREHLDKMDVDLDVFLQDMFDLQQQVKACEHMTSALKQTNALKSFLDDEALSAYKQE